jgi:hypothetical protein
MNRLTRGLAFAAAIAALALGAGDARAQNTTTTVKPDGTVETKTVAVEVTGGPRLEIYGFAQADMGYDFKQTNPDWYDVLRTTKLPSYANQFGEDGTTWASVRQSRLGVKGWFPSSLGEIKTIFEFELFGTGVDAGQTTFRLRHAWGEVGQFGAGQTWSPFMDPDVFPNSLEYWGPPGMAFFRNVQIRWMPMQGDNELFIALERPGASGDGGNYADRVELQGVKIRTQYPDISAHYKTKGKWGHVQLAGIVRFIKWDDNNADQYDLSGSTTGWGLNLSTNLNLGDSSVIRASALYGEGVENYMNDAPIDIGIQNNFGDKTKPIVGKALPVLGLVAFLDHSWNKQFSTAIGWSYIQIDNTDGQTPSDFKDGNYALANVLYYPVPGVMAGAEFQYGKRRNFTDGFSSDDYRIQFSFKYNFSYKLGGK